MIVKRNIAKRLGRTVIHVVTGSGAVEVMMRQFVETGDIGIAAKTGAVIAATALVATLHSWLDNMLPKRRHVDVED